MKTFSNFIRKNNAHIEALAPFSVALALLVFAFIPGSAKAASTTYYVDIPNLGSYGNGIGGAVSYVCNGASCSVNGSGGNGSGYGSNPNSYPNYAYQYYRNPNPGAATNGSQNNGGSSYVPIKASYVPYNFPTYVQYMKQADGTYKLGTAKTPPAYAWNADNSLLSNVAGNAYNGGFTPSAGSTGRGFTMTSGY